MFIVLTSTFFLKYKGFNHFHKNNFYATSYEIFEIRDKYTDSAISKTNIVSIKNS